MVQGCLNENTGTCSDLSWKPRLALCQNCSKLTLKEEVTNFKALSEEDPMQLTD